MRGRQPVLILIQGSEPGSIYKLRENRLTTVGRSSRNSVPVMCSGVSRFHCEIAYVNGEWQLTDLNSKKGTIVNGQRVAGKCLLLAGDTVRLDTNVFRFDMIDETLREDGAMLAIVEAELDQKLIKKGEAAFSLDDIRARSRFEGEQSREERRLGRAHLKANAAFLAAVAFVAAAAVAAALLQAGRASAPSEGPNGAREREALSLYGQAVSAMQGGDRTEALRLLAEVQRTFPGTQPGRQAAEKRAELVWAALQEGLSRAVEFQAEGDYAAALALYDELAALGDDGRARQLVQQSRDYAVRRAAAAP